MARFIPVNQINQLREAARSGDERAKSILHAQMNGEDFDLDSYFNPEPPVEDVVEAKATETEETPFEMYLRENEIKLDDSNRDDIIREFEEVSGRKAEFSNKPVEEDKEDPLDMQDLLDDEVEAINGYNEFLNKLLVSDIDEAKKALIKEKISKIIADEQQHIDILKGLSCIKDENLIENEEITE